MPALDRLLAKGVGAGVAAPPEEATLPAHAAATASVAHAVLGAVSDPALRELSLEPSEWLDSLVRVVTRAAWVHDCGKATDQWQAMIRAPGTVLLGLRHEEVSVWMLVADRGPMAWMLEGCSELERHALIAAVLGHHLKAASLDDLGPRSGTGALRLGVLSGHDDFAVLCRRAGDDVGLAAPSAIRDTEMGMLRADPEVRAAVRSCALYLSTASHRTARFVALAKALLVASDVAGSAVVRDGEDAGEWGLAALSRLCSGSLLDKVVEERLNGNRLRQFQRDMASSRERVTFVRAGCGSGKTLGAYAWAARHAGGRKLFFCYPTTGTATEGYADYVLEVDGLEAELVHSRAQADLELLPATDDGDPVGEGAGRSAVAGALEEHRRRWGLQTWDAQATVATVDAVLGLVQNARRSLFSSPAILNGAFVFDEIHQYDERLFGALLTFLGEASGASVMLMTASLQPVRLMQLKRTLEEHGEGLRIVNGPPEFESVPRYRLSWSDPETAAGRVGEALDSGKRVLWVCNTVDRCREVALRSVERFESPVLAYHSRFRYQDRARRHRAVVDAFAGGGAQAVLAVTTQVCEVSLDLSADLLVTELAPAPAMIQRLGRLNRRVDPDDPPAACPGLVIDPPNHLPYGAAKLEKGRRWLDALLGTPRSQADLSLAFETLSRDDDPVPRIESAWLDGGAFSYPGQLREPGTNISVIREEDLGLDLSAATLTRLAIPMPLWAVAGEVDAWRRLGAYFVAPRGRIAYDDLLGAAWTEVEGE